VSRRRAALLLCAVAAAPAPAGQTAAPAGRRAAPEDALWRGFQEPPTDARPMVRWWWFGPAAESAEVDREIAAMKRGGFGGFEVQPVYPLTPDGALPGLRNSPFLSRPFLDVLAHAGRTARAAGLRVDVTGGTGWPFGGPHVPLDRASADVRMVRVPVSAGSDGAPLPRLADGETFLSAAIGPAAPGRADRPLTPVRLSDPDAARFAPADAPRELLVFVAGRTGQQVKRAAVGGEGYVLDHMDPAAVALHLSAVAQPLLDAFAGQRPPDALFSDSLEAYGASWTGDLLPEFRRRRGYDLLPHLPALFLNAAGGDGVRHDWALTLSELVEERYLTLVDRWASAHGTRFRAQVYGTPPVTLSANAAVALPEGEGDDWRSFTSTRWATSAAHLYGRPVVSSETWTWLHSPAWAATPLDMKAEADRHFLQGVTQLVGHGWPYSPPAAGAPGWAFYAAAALSDRNPWYDTAMPAVTRYLTRASFLLRQGRPANRVAIYLPIEDAFAAMRPERASANDAMRERVPDALVGQVLDSGFGFDFVDAAAVRAGRLDARVLVLPPMTRVDARAWAAVERWIAGGGRLVAVGALPTLSGGLRDAAATRAVAAASRRLAGRAATGVGTAGLPERLRAAAAPDVAGAPAELGFVRRELDAGTLYFVANTANRPLDASVRFAGDAGGGQWWDAAAGTRLPAGTGEVRVALAPYESRFLFLPRAGGAASAEGTPSRRLAATAVTGWTLAADGQPARPAAVPGSWADLPELRHYSGTVAYRATFDTAVAPGTCLALDFGQGTPRPRDTRARHRADLDAPVRDAARVLVNGRDAGVLWAPPYRLDLEALVRPGRNTLEVRVANTALDALAARPRPDRRLLTARYGERFQDQDTDAVVPQPSGLTAPVTLVRGTAGSGPCGGVP